MITLGELYRGAYLCGMVSVVEIDAEPRKFKPAKYNTLYSGYSLIGIPEELLKRTVRYISSELDDLKAPVVIIEVYRG